MLHNIKKENVFLIKFILLILLLLYFTSCTKVSNKDVDLDKMPETIFSVSDSRSNYASSWNNIEGSMEFQFKYNVNEDGEVSDEEGSFTLQYINFRRPQLCSFGESCYCTGFMKGSFVEQNNSSVSTTEEESGPYNPLDPFIDEESTTESQIEEESNTTIYPNYFVLTIEEESMSEDCDERLQSFPVSIYRFIDGTAIYDDGIQHLSTPINNL